MWVGWLLSDFNSTALRQNPKLLSPKCSGGDFLHGWWKSQVWGVSFAWSLLPAVGWLDPSAPQWPPTPPNWHLGLSAGRCWLALPHTGCPARSRAVSGHQHRLGKRLLVEFVWNIFLFRETEVPELFEPGSGERRKQGIGRYLSNWSHIALNVLRRR